MNTATQAGNFEIGKILRLPAFFVCKKKKGEDVEHRKTYRLGIAAGSPALDSFKRAWETAVPQNTHTARYIVPLLPIPLQ